MKKLLIIFILLGICPKTFADQGVSEDYLKAAFIYHFISYTEWNDTLPDYNVCIPEDRGLREAAEESLFGKVVNNRKIVVLARYEGCHILISDNATPTPNTLTIGHLNQGALFEFRLAGNKMKFAVDVDELKSRKFKVSSQLLKLAIAESSGS